MPRPSNFLPPLSGFVPNSEPDPVVPPTSRHDTATGAHPAAAMSGEKVDETTLVLKSSTEMDARFAVGQSGLRHADTAESLGGRYVHSDMWLVPEGTLGKGASSRVVKAIHTLDCSLVALKQVNAFDDVLRRQLLTEVTRLARSSRDHVSPKDLVGKGDDGSGSGEVCGGNDESGTSSRSHLVTTHGCYFVPASGDVCLVLECMDGGSLGDVLARVRTQGWPGKAPGVPETVLRVLAHGMVAGLLQLHNSFRQVHRDVKPENVLLTTSGEVKLSDFGLSGDLLSTLGNRSTFVGTLCYMSPERIRGEPYSTAADIWSLGVVVYECFVGRYPFGDGNLSHGPFPLMMEVVRADPPRLAEESGASESLRDFVARCLDRDASLRASASELLQHPFLEKCTGDRGCDLVAAWLQEVGGTQPRSNALVFGAYFVSLMNTEASPNEATVMDRLSALLEMNVVLTDGKVRVAGRRHVVDFLLAAKREQKGLGSEALRLKDAVGACAVELECVAHAQRWRVTFTSESQGHIRNINEIAEVI